MHKITRLLNAKKGTRTQPYLRLVPCSSVCRISRGKNKGFTVFQWRQDGMSETYAWPPQLSCCCWRRCRPALCVASRCVFLPFNVCLLFCSSVKEASCLLSFSTGDQSTTGIQHIFSTFGKRAPAPGLQIPWSRRRVHKYILSTF